MRRKPIPNPIVRAPGTVRPLVSLPQPRGFRSVLPTIAALLATAAIGCQREATPIRPDLPIETPIAEASAKKLPGMGALETPTEIEPTPYVPLDPRPPSRPHPVKKSVSPVPSPPPMPGGIGMVKPSHPPTT